MVLYYSWPAHKFVPSAGVLFKTVYNRGVTGTVYDADSIGTVRALFTYSTVLYSVVQCSLYQLK